jgi:hypothetical protein
MKNKIIIGIIALFVLLLIGNTIRLKYKIDKLNNNVVSLKQDADLKIGRAESLTVNAENKIALLTKQQQEDIAKHKSLVDMYTELQAKYSVKGSGTIVVQGPTKEIYVTVEGKPVQLKNMPFKFDDFRLHVDADAITKDFKYSLNQNFEVQLAETKSKNGTYNHYADLYELDSGGKRIGKLELTKFQVVKSSDVEQAKFKFFDPRLDLGLNYIFYKNLDHGFGGDLGISLMSYGKSADLTWRFLRFATGINNQGVSLSLGPALYNIASPLPLINNIWLNPSLGTNLDNHIYYIGIGVSAIL